MSKRWLTGLSLLLAASMVAGCGSKDAGTDNSSGDDGGKINYSMQVWDSSYKWDTPINKKLEEKTGVSFEYLPIVDSGGSGASKVDVWLASEDYPDIINDSPLTIGKYKDAGAVIPLEELIEEHGPNIKKKFGKYFDLLKDEEGHIYSLYGVNLATEPSPDSQASFLVQYDVLEEAGYPEIKTLDQLYTVLESYYKKHPKTEDGKDVIPFSGISGGLLDINPALNAAGLPDHGFYEIKNDNVSFAMTSDEVKQYMKFLNKLQNAGMLDKEVFSLNAETAGAKITQGRVLATYMPAWLMRGYESSIIANGDYDKLYAKFPIMLNEGIEDQSNGFPPTNSSTNLAITSKAKNPERIIQLIDYLFTDEGQILMNWGIEGQHFDIVDGKRVRNADFDAKIKADPTVGTSEGIQGPFNRFSYGNGAKLDDGDYATPITKDFVASSYDDRTKEVLAKYGKQTWADFAAKPVIYPTMLWQLNTPEDAKPIAIKLEEIWHKEAAKVILSKTEAEFESSWNGAVSQIEKNGKQKLDESMTKVWQDFMARYNQAVK